MSNRRRATRTSRSYSARVQRRSASVPKLRRQPPWWRRWWTLPWPALALAVAAEAGHLATSYLEWPASAARGGYHVGAGALLGLVAAAVVTGTGGPRLAAASAVVLAGPGWWLAGTLLDAAPYHRVPGPAAAVIVTGEIVLGALLVHGWLATTAKGRPGLSAG